MKTPELIEIDKHTIALASIFLFAALLFFSSGMAMGLLIARSIF